MLSFFTDSFTGCDWTGTWDENWGCCSSSHPCGVSEGQCYNDDECLGHLLCGTDNCFTPFPGDADCCYDPFPGKQISKGPFTNYVMHFFRFFTTYLPVVINGYILTTTYLLITLYLALTPPPLLMGLEKSGFFLKFEVQII